MSIPTVNWDPSRYSVLDIVKALFMVLEDLVEDEEAQVTGINLLVDLFIYIIIYYRLKVVSYLSTCSFI